MEDTPIQAAAIEQAKPMRALLAAVGMFTHPSTPNFSQDNNVSTANHAMIEILHAACEKHSIDIS